MHGRVTKRLLTHVRPVRVREQFAVWTENTTGVPVGLIVIGCPRRLGSRNGPTGHDDVSSRATSSSNTDRAQDPSGCDSQAAQHALPAEYRCDASHRAILSARRVTPFDAEGRVDRGRPEACSVHGLGGWAMTQHGAPIRAAAARSWPERPAGAADRPVRGGGRCDRGAGRYTFPGFRTAGVEASTQGPDSCEPGSDRPSRVGAPAGRTAVCRGILVWSPALAGDVDAGVSARPSTPFAGVLWDIAVVLPDGA